MKILALLALLIVLTGCIEVEDEFCPPDMGEFEEEMLAGSATQEKQEDYQNLPKKIVKEGELVNFPNLGVNDPDGDEIIYTFSEPLNDKGEWLTKKGDAGNYKVKITASDGENVISQEIMLIVESTNKPPKIQTLKTIKLRTGEVLDLQPKINDPEGDAVTVSYKGWKTELPYTITKDDVGTHTLTIVAFDGTAKTEEDVTIVIEKINHAPKLDAIQDIEIFELDRIMVAPEASDIDEDKITYTFSTPLDSQGFWIPQKGDAGEYQVEITASDGKLTDITNFKITVLEYNQPPILLGIKDITVKEGDLVQTSISAEDPEGNPVEIIFSGWMTSSTKQTTHDDAGEHTVTVTAFDGEKTTRQAFKIVVENRNRPPVFNPGSFN